MSITNIQSRVHLRSIVGDGPVLLVYEEKTVNQGANRINKKTERLSYLCGCPTYGHMVFYNGNFGLNFAKSFLVKTPSSVMMPATYLSGVASKAGL